MKKKSNFKKSENKKKTRIKEKKACKIEKTPVGLERSNDILSSNTDEQHLEKSENHDLLLKCQKIVGVKNTDFALQIIINAMKTIKPILGEETSIQIVIESLIDFQPKDAIEARLVIQAIVAHAYAMNGSRVSGNADMLCHIEAMSNLSIKLMRIHNETIETLARYRRGGTQQVIVQHQSNVMSDKTVVNHIGVGVFTQNQGDSPCPQGNAEQKREPITINHVDNPPWPMDDADYTAEKVAARKQNMGSEELD